MKRNSVIIIGGGITGLISAYFLQKSGYAITLLEREPSLGGYAQSTSLGSFTLDRFYHFICRGDKKYLSLLNELGLGKKVIWKKTKMGYLLSPGVVPFGSLLSLFKFPLLTVFDKFRYLVMIMEAFFGRGKNIQEEKAWTWLEKRLGKRCFTILWQQLLLQKFKQYAPEVSAEWLARRMIRHGASRQGITEVLGYLEGGCATFVSALEKAVLQEGGQIIKNTSVKEVMSTQDNQYEVQTSEGNFIAARVISTIPLPLVPQLFSKMLSSSWKDSYSSLAYGDVLCGVFIFNQSLSPYFWTNVSSSSITGNTPITGCIEFTNLYPRQDGKSIIYVPLYTTTLQEDLAKGNNFWFSLCIEFFKELNPNFRREWIEESCFQQGKWAQPLCFVQSKKNLPPIRVHNGVWCVDNSHFFPEDRSFQECTTLAYKLVHEVEESFKSV